MLTVKDERSLLEAIGSYVEAHPDLTSEQIHSLLAHVEFALFNKDFKELKELPIVRQYGADLLQEGVIRRMEALESKGGVLSIKYGETRHPLHA